MGDFDGTCHNCGLPDPYRGQGDSYGSCDCPRCTYGCGAGPGDCDCYRESGDYDENTWGEDD